MGRYPRWSDQTDFKDNGVVEDYTGDLEQKRKDNK